MTKDEFNSLRVGDYVWDTLHNRSMQVTHVYPESNFNQGSIVQFKWTETTTIYNHGAHTLKQTNV